MGDGEMDADFDLSADLEGEAAAATFWVLRVTLPDSEAVRHLKALLATRTGGIGVDGGTSLVSADYATEAAARVAMALVLSERPDATCTVVEDRPAPAD